MRDLSRRRFVQGTGAAIAASALAGCGSDGGGGGGGDEVPQEIADHLEGANGYDDSIDDQTGEDEVTVDVGGGDGFAFTPAALRVDAGTTVVWEWTGDGSPHNVVSTDDSDGDFESELYSDEGQTFEQTFEEAGNMLYVCEPHEQQGMKGAVEVVEG